MDAGESAASPLEEVGVERALSALGRELERLNARAALLENGAQVDVTYLRAGERGRVHRVSFAAWLLCSLADEPAPRESDEPGAARALRLLAPALQDADPDLRGVVIGLSPSAVFARRGRRTLARIPLAPAPRCA